VFRNGGQGLFLFRSLRDRPAPSSPVTLIVIAQNMKQKPSQLNGIPIPYDTSVAELENMMRAPAPQCWVAIIALGHIPGLESLGLLAQQLTSSDPYVRRAALEAIGFHPEGDKLEQDVLRCFRHSSDVVSREACRTSASLRLGSAHDNVVALFGASSESTRLTAVAALSKLWHATDLDKLITVFQYDRSEKVRKEAAWVLRAHATPDNCQVLFHLWWADAVSRHRKWACELAAAFDVQCIEKQLDMLTNDPDGHVRRAAQVAREKRKNTIG